MCLILFAWKVRADMPLIVAANRDEWHQRPATAATWWPGQTDLLAGRDLQAGGAWLGVTRTGKFAAITNFRGPSPLVAHVTSRGHLVVDYLRGEKTPQQYLDQVTTRHGNYHGFNLLLGDAKHLLYYSSVDNKIEAVPPGIHGLSNRALNTSWPKVAIGRFALGKAIEPEVPEGAIPERLLAILSNPSRAAEELLPDTGVGLEWEHKLSPALIISPDYGTRCSTIFIARSIANRATSSIRTRASFIEHGRNPLGDIISTATFEFSHAAR